MTKRGRPSKFNPKDAAEIIARLSKGEPLTRICAEEWMPCDNTVRAWAEADASFSAGIARARELGFDYLAAQCLEIADTPEQGVETVEKADGSIETRTGDMLGHRKLKIETRLKLLAKWDPKRYGDKLDVNHAGGVKLVVQPLDDQI